MSQELDQLGKLLSQVPLQPTPFVRKAEIEKNITQHIKEAKGHRIILHTYLRWSVAACLLIATSIGTWVKMSEIRIDTTTAMDITLPDGSTVNIGENSFIEYNKALWIFSRNISMSGQAKYSVIKGKRFCVKTEAGSIVVLGTVFSVDQNGENMNVECIEGSVKVDTRFGSQKLEMGESVRCSSQGMEYQAFATDEEIENENIYPELEYDNESLLTVIARYEEIYNVEVTPKSLCSGLTDRKSVV